MNYGNGEPYNSYILNKIPFLANHSEEFDIKTQDKWRTIRHTEVKKGTVEYKLDTYLTKKYEYQPSEQWRSTGNGWRTIENNWRTIKDIMANQKAYNGEPLRNIWRTHRDY